MKKIFFLSIIILCLTGCLFDFYRDSKYATEAIDEWFYYKNGSDDLGLTRRKLENISKIKEKSCKYKEHDKNKIYIYECKITYTPIGETVIPLSKNETITVYVAIKYDKDSYIYRVYNSKEKEGIWKEDENLGYGK